MDPWIFNCEGCGQRLRPDETVRALYRELPREGEQPFDRMRYSHIGHEPRGFRLTGRGRLEDLADRRREGGYTAE
jgi:hypothetical protein